VHVLGEGVGVVDAPVVVEGGGAGRFEPVDQQVEPGRGVPAVGAALAFVAAVAATLAFAAAAESRKWFLILGTVYCGLMVMSLFLI
jgi:hypothetical protein